MPQLEKRGLIQFNAAENVLEACRGKQGEYNRELPLTLTLHEDGTAHLSNGDESVIALDGTVLGWFPVMRVSIELEAHRKGSVALVVPLSSAQAQSLVS